MTEQPGGWDCHVHLFDGTPATPGHYQPVPCTLEQIEALASAHGLGRLVLVQPSVYGADNRLLLNALRASTQRHRGVVVLGEAPVANALVGMHALGVRGARLNAVSPVGESGDVAQRFQTLAPLLQELGWHLQWYAPPSLLGRIADLHGKAAPPCVLDHLAGLHAGLSPTDPTWAALARLADQGAWIKLSGWYRLGAQAPYAALLEHIQRVERLFADRMVWGSDWPHTSFAPAARPDYASLWQPVVDALGAGRAARLRNAAPAIYR